MPLAPLSPHARDIVFLGDSLTDGAAWPDWVTATLRDHGYPHLRLHNAGVGGHRADQILARLQPDVLALRPHAVFFHAGTNDMWQNRPLDAYRTAVDAILATLAAHGIPVWCMTAPPVAPPAMETQIQACNTLLTQLAARHGCHLIDVHAALAQGLAAGRTILAPDGVHHALDAWILWAQAILTALGCPAPLRQTIAEFPHTLHGWHVGPPVPYREGQPLPDLPTDLASFAPWNPAAALAQANPWIQTFLQRGMVFPLGPVRPPDTGAFAYTDLPAAAPAARPPLLRVGGSFPLALWLNGQPLWQAPAYHGMHPDSDRLPLPLRPGPNRLLAFSTWSFHAALDPVPATEPRP